MYGSIHRALCLRISYNKIPTFKRFPYYGDNSTDLIQSNVSVWKSKFMSELLSIIGFNLFAITFSKRLDMIEGIEL